MEDFEALSSILSRDLLSGDLMSSFAAAFPSDFFGDLSGVRGPSPRLGGLLEEAFRGGIALGGDRRMEGLSIDLI